ncbi:MAG TPA: alpha/beta hydrolase [Candidatus Binataceae bacterium]|nr:alpha/beta hydrolase [Candidatus Binataceae bacterium]
MSVEPHRNGKLKGAGVAAAHANGKSAIAQTPRGAIEYSLDGEGPVVLAMHGTPGGYDQILALSGEISAAGFKIIGWSRPGYLRTQISVGRTFEEQADAAAHLLDTLGHDRVAIYGASGGGPAAIQFALRHPDRVWGLMLECAIANQFPVSWRAKLAYVLLFNDIVLKLQGLYSKFALHRSVRGHVAGNGTLTDDEIEKLAASIVGDPDRLQILDSLISAMSPARLRRRGIENDAGQFETMAAPALDRIRCPALVIHGTADAEVPFAHGEHAAKSIPGAEFYPVPGGIHLLWLTDDAPQIRARKIAFLKRHAPAHDVRASAASVA